MPGQTVGALIELPPGASGVPLNYSRAVWERFRNRFQQVGKIEISHYCRAPTRRLRAEWSARPALPKFFTPVVKGPSVRAHENLAARQGRTAIAKRLPVQNIGGMGVAVEIVDAYGYARLLPVVAIGCF